MHPQPAWYSSHHMLAGRGVLEHQICQRKNPRHRPTQRPSCTRRGIRQFRGGELRGSNMVPHGYTCRRPRPSRLTEWVRCPSRTARGRASPAADTIMSTGLIFRHSSKNPVSGRLEAASWGHLPHVFPLRFMDSGTASTYPREESRPKVVAVILPYWPVQSRLR